MRDHPTALPSPYDTWPGASLRFLVEMTAWVAGAWVAARWVGVWSIPIARVLLMTPPAVFSGVGDKEKVIVAVPGPVRWMIELDLSIIAVVAVWLLVGPGGGMLVLGVVLAAQVAGWRRSHWLLTGAAPPPDGFR